MKAPGFAGGSLLSVPEFRIPALQFEKPRAICNACPGDFDSSFRFRLFLQPRFRLAKWGHRERLGVEGDFQRCLAAGAVGAVPQRKTASVAFGNLAAQQQANAGTAGLGGEEGHEEIAGIRNA